MVILALVLGVGGLARAEALDPGDMMAPDDGPPRDPEAQHTVHVRMHLLRSQDATSVPDVVVGTEEEARGIIPELNAAYGSNGAPFTFVLDGVDVVPVPAADVDLPYGDSDTSQKLYDLVDPHHPDVLHIFMIGMSCRSQWAGWADYPGPWRAAAFIRSGRGSKTSKTAIHEIGHWLGVPHVFQGGCEDLDGDSIDDTPPQRLLDKGNPDRCAPDYVPPLPQDCSVVVDSCPDQPGVDSVSNYMSYFDSACKNSFTPGQVARMMRVWEKYKAPRDGKGDDGGEGIDPAAGCAVGGQGRAPVGLLIGLLALVVRRRHR